MEQDNKTIYLVKTCVSANFGTLSGWHTEKYDTREEAEAHADGFSIIEEVEADYQNPDVLGF